jgi:hypothetical protein
VSRAGLVALLSLAAAAITLRRAVVVPGVEARSDT